MAAPGVGTEHARPSPLGVGNLRYALRGAVITAVVILLYRLMFSRSFDLSTISDVGIGLGLGFVLSLLASVVVLRRRERRKERKTA